MTTQIKQLISLGIVLALYCVSAFADHGNTYNYREGDASYVNYTIIWNYNHTGLVSYVSSSSPSDSSSRIYEMKKEDTAGNCIEYNSMSTHKSGRTWYGSYSHKEDITDSKRQAIKNIASELYSRGDVGYTWAVNTPFFEQL